MIWAGLGLLAVVGIAQCARLFASMGEKRPQAEAEVRRFHELLNAAHCAELWQQADPGFRQESTLERFNEMCETIAERLGAAGQFQAGSFSMNQHNSELRIKADYKTQFAKASAVETFVFNGVDGQLRLYGYHIDSEAFLRKAPPAATPR